LTKIDPVSADDAAGLMASQIADLPAASNRQYASSLSCVQYCASVAISEAFVPEFDSTCISSRIPVPRVTETKCVKFFIKLANRCINAIMIVQEKSTDRKNNQGHWRRRMTPQISKLRKNLSQLVAIDSNSTLTPRLRAIKKHLFKLYVYIHF